MYEVTFRFQEEHERDYFLFALSLAQCHTVNLGDFSLNFDPAFECFEWDGQGNPVVSVTPKEELSEEAERWLGRKRLLHKYNRG